MSKKLLIIKGVFFLAAILLIPSGFVSTVMAADKPVEIKVAFGDSSASVFYRGVLEPWGKELEAASNGKIKTGTFVMIR